LDQRWGVITLAHYWEGGMYDTEAIDTQPFYGFGGALRVYLRYVAIPALRFDATYNLEADEIFYNFTLGFAM
ncbi:MAG: hypothetical protein MI748_16945, partial [Opitutales bacterium]|nr:hypothetical protein [Opitutales bacterium]